MSCKIIFVLLKAKHISKWHRFLLLFARTYSSVDINKLGRVTGYFKVLNGVIYKIYDKFEIKAKNPIGVISFVPKPNLYYKVVTMSNYLDDKIVNGKTNPPDLDKIHCISTSRRNYNIYDHWVKRKFMGAEYES